MNRLAWIVSVLMVGCGSGPQNNAGDGGLDATADTPRPCAVDFPCANPWACIDSTHWVEVKSVPKPPCSGLTCESTGVTHTCDPGLECVTNPELQSTIACAYGGHDGCLPADAGSFTPNPIGAAPTKQAGACTDMVIQEVWDYCLDPTTADQNKCTSLATLYPSCGKCMQPVVTVVDTGTNDLLWAPNIGGCYALLEGTSAPGSCAALADANMQCAIAVCKNGCMLYPDGFVACVSAARKSACAAFPICDGEAGAAYATCEPTSVKDFVIGFGETLCGP